MSQKWAESGQSGHKSGQLGVFVHTKWRKKAFFVCTKMTKNELMYIQQLQLM